MAKETEISWCDCTWNVARGCSKVDADCLFCYMYRESLNGTRYEPKDVVKTKTVFKFPLTYKEKKSSVWEGRPLVFTSSLTDVFHPDIDSFRDEIWDIIRSCPHLIFQILTKRPERMEEHLPSDWGKGWDNVWLGTSVGSDKSAERIADLIYVPAKTRFLSLEPLHGSIDLSPFLLEPNDILINPIDWVIVGGESGNGKHANESGVKYGFRECKIEWIEDIVNKCSHSKIPVFVKQLGTHLSKEMGLKDRHGRDMNEFPEHLRIRQFPKLRIDE